MLSWLVEIYNLRRLMLRYYYIKKKRFKRWQIWLMPIIIFEERRFIVSREGYWGKYDWLASAEIKEKEVIKMLKKKGRRRRKTWWNPKRIEGKMIWRNKRCKRKEKSNKTRKREK